MGGCVFLGVESFSHHCEGAPLPALLAAERMMELGGDLRRWWESNSGAGIAGAAMPWLTSFRRIIMRIIVTPT